MENTLDQRGNSNLEALVKHDYADSHGVKIHIASLGAGPLVVMIHGFPDHWYTWHHQMESLAPDYQVVAMDLRGYNLSDRPKGVENYSLRMLVGDVQAVIRHLGCEEAIIVGHDWGGAIAWHFARNLPAMTGRLILLNQPHPRGLVRELVHNPQQRQNSQYARDFQQEGAHLGLTPELIISQWLPGIEHKEKYLQALRRSDFEAMLNYYRRNFPREPYTESTSPVTKVQAPVLIIHGLADQALLASGLNNTWEWVEKDLTIVTVPGAGHFVQHDAADLVTRTIRSWLER